MCLRIPSSGFRTREPYVHCHLEQKARFHLFPHLSPLPRRAPLGGIGARIARCPFIRRFFPSFFSSHFTSFSFTSFNVDLDAPNRITPSFENACRRFENS